MSDPGDRAPEIDDFLVEPTRDIGDWQWLWSGDHRFPIRSDRGGLVGRVIVLFKKIFGSLVQTPQDDLWERQRIFHLSVLEHLERAEHLQEVARQQGARLIYLESFLEQGLDEVMHHNDALFARVDQKLDHHRRRTRDLSGRLGAVLAVEDEERVPALSRVREETVYLELERRHRGTEEEIANRIHRYVSLLEGRGQVLDLGCGRGESLALFGRYGIPIRGVDSNAQMVARCQDRGYVAVEGDLFEELKSVKEGSLGGVVSFHVVEHLPIELLDRLVRLAWRALGPGGVLILETPSPLSMVAGARNFWIDPTHRRPIHPEFLRRLYERAGFESIERFDLQPFSDEDRPPEIDPSGAPEELAELASQVNRMRDRIDEVLYGFQDYAMVGEKAKTA